MTDDKPARLLGRETGIDTADATADGSVAASQAGIRLPPHCSNCGYPCCGAESTHIEHGGVAWMRPDAEAEAWLIAYTRRAGEESDRGSAGGRGDG